VAACEIRLKCHRVLYQTETPIVNATAAPADTQSRINFS